MNLIYKTKWIPAEWGYSNNKIQESEISKIVPILFEKSICFDAEEEFDKYQIMSFGMMEKVLKQTIELGVFGEYSDKITFFNSISDDERIERIEKYSAKTLNSNELYE